MDYQSYKVEFADWLKSRPEFYSGDDYIRFVNMNSDISIFAYSEEFKKFLYEEKNVDSSVLNMNLSEILSMDIVDGKLVKNDQSANNENEATQEDDAVEQNIQMVDTEDVLGDTFSQEGVTENLETDEFALGGDDFDFGIEMLNDFLDEDIVKKNLDLDKNGEIDKKELEAYLSLLDVNGEVTFDDLVAAFQKMEYDDNENNLINDELDETEPAPTDTNAINSQNITNPIQNINSSSYSGSSSFSSYNSGKTQSNRNTDPLDKMSIDELKEAKASKQNEIDSTNEQIDSVLNEDDDESIKNQDEIDAKKEAFKQALIDNEKLDEQQAQIVINMTSLNNQINIITQRQEIVENMISSQNQIIRDDESYISSLNDTLSNLPDKGTSDYPQDEKQSAKIEERRSKLQEMINKANERLETDKSVLNDRENQKAELQSQLDEKNKEFNELENQSGINFSELELSEETLKLSKEYTDEESKVEAAKNKKLSSLSQTLKTQQKDLSDIDKKISEKAKTAYSPKLSVLPEHLLKGDLEGKEELVCEIAEKYGLDPILVVSIIILESGWGEAQAAPNNFMGYTGSGDIASSNRFGAFSSIEAGLEAGIRNLSEYANRYAEVYAVDYDNLDAIGAHYCPGGTWPNKIRAVYDTVLSRMAQS